MIVAMYKYGFLVYHREYDRFLGELQQLGVLHIIEKKQNGSEEVVLKSGLLNRMENAVQFLEKRNKGQNISVQMEDASEIVEVIRQKQELLEALNQELIAARKEVQQAIPWGYFSTATICKLKSAGVHVRFFVISKKKFSRSFAEKYHAERIGESQTLVYFIVIQHRLNELNFEAHEVSLPGKDLSELENHVAETEQKISRINDELDNLASSVPDILRHESESIRQSLEFDRASRQTQKKFDDKLMILEGWVPATKKKQTDEFLNANRVLFTVQKATPKDKAPVLLQNNRYSKLFEPIGKIFSLPAYCELDLTVFFAPFFMLFFGFCLGDAGYGLLYILAAGIYKLRAPKTLRPYLTLIQYLGMGTILFGLVSGTLFGINLIQADFMLRDNIRNLFLDPESMFNLAIVLGAVQIVFGMFLKAANQIRQFGFVYALGTFGWLFILFGCTIYIALTSQKIITPNKLILNSILLSGGFLILFFSDPEAGVFSRMGKGIWDIYSTVTGIFGDLLSYIRLFAIGLSSSILGYVVNDIALTILDTSPVIGPVLFVIFLFIGHTLNIMISTLGSFVHPMRLTFVEFYKNAGFMGGGTAYKPFSRNGRF